MRISCITPSYNKPEYIYDALDSVFAQSCRDWKYLVVDNSTVRMPFIDIEYQDKRLQVESKEFSFLDRKNEYPTAIILNEYLDQLPGDIIMYLSDDDIFAPNCFEVINKFFEDNPDAMVCYFGMKSIKGSNEKGWIDNGEMRATTLWPKGSNLDCVIDGGAVAFRKECLQKLEKPYFVTDWLNASHCDGLFLTKFCEHFDFYPIDQFLLTHRTTELSAHTYVEK